MKMTSKDQNAAFYVFMNDLREKVKILKHSSSEWRKS